MKRGWNVFFIALVVIAVVALFSIMTRNGNVKLLHPAGYIAQSESSIIIAGLIIAFTIAILVLVATLVIIFRYQDTNKNREYRPYEKASKFQVTLWWLLPSLIIFFWAIAGWQSTFALDPYKPIPSFVKPIQIQVVALQWKWLFIYPEQHIATINTIQLPVNIPVHFQLTADAPFNSFQIPSLGSQIYAMPGMTSQLNLIANKMGTFQGQSSEMSGDGFSDMQFKVVSTSYNDYVAWVKSVQNSKNTFSLDTYKSIVKPSTYHTYPIYNLLDTNLFNQVILKYMSPDANANI